MSCEETIKDHIMFAEKTYNISCVSNLQNTEFYQVYVPTTGMAKPIVSVMKDKKFYEEKVLTGKVEKISKGRLENLLSSVKKADMILLFMSLVAKLKGTFFSATVFYDYALSSGINLHDSGYVKKHLEMLCSAGFLLKYAFKRAGQKYPYLYVYYANDHVPAELTRCIDKKYYPRNPILEFANCTQIPSWKAGELFEYARIITKCTRLGYAPALINALDTSRDTAPWLSVEINKQKCCYVVSRRHKGETEYITHMLDELMNKLSEKKLCDLFIVAEDEEHIKSLKKSLRGDIVKKAEFLTDKYFALYQHETV